MTLLTGGANFKTFFRPSLRNPRMSIPVYVLCQGCERALPGGFAPLWEATDTDLQAADAGLSLWMVGHGFTARRPQANRIASMMIVIWTALPIKSHRSVTVLLHQVSNLRRITVSPSPRATNPQRGWLGSLGEGR